MTARRRTTFQRHRAVPQHHSRPSTRLPLLFHPPRPRLLAFLIVVLVAHPPATPSSPLPAGSLHGRAPLHLLQQAFAIASLSLQCMNVLVRLARASMRTHTRPRSLGHRLRRPWRRARATAARLVARDGRQRAAGVDVQRTTRAARACGRREWHDVDVTRGPAVGVVDGGRAARAFAFAWPVALVVVAIAVAALA